jgi:hypothetical protein
MFDSLAPTEHELILFVKLQTYSPYGASQFFDFSDFPVQVSIAHFGVDNQLFRRENFWFCFWFFPVVCRVIAPVSRGCFVAAGAPGFALLLAMTPVVWSCF